MNRSTFSGESLHQPVSEKAKVYDVYYPCGVLFFTRLRQERN